MLNNQSRIYQLIVLVLGIFIITFITTLTYKRVTAVKAAPYRSSIMEISAPQGVITNCTIVDIHVSTDRIHAHCSTDVSGIEYFAINSDPVHQVEANRYLTLWNSAFALGKQVSIWYDDNPDNNPPGCLTTNCRRVTAVEIK
jgi:hypothetical protein